MEGMELICGNGHIQALPYNEKPPEKCLFVIRGIGGVPTPCNQPYTINKTSVSDIVGKDVETTVNEAGGKQSKVPVRFDLIDARALFEQAKVLHEGAEKYGVDNWRLIPVHDHLNHLIMHAYAYLAGDQSDEHLSHIMCRATFAQGVAISDEGKKPHVCLNCQANLENCDHFDWCPKESRHYE